MINLTTISMGKFIKKMFAVENKCKRASEWHNIKRNNKRIRFCVVYAI